MLRNVIWVAALLVLMVPMLAASPQQSILVRTQSGEVVWCMPTKIDDVVQLQFTHSMYGGYVRESWRVTPARQLDRVRFVTENAAAAEYYATDGSSFRAEDGFVVPGEPLLQSELIVRVNSRGNHWLTVDDESIHLAEELQASTQVRISVESGSCDTRSESMSGKDD